MIIKKPSTAGTLESSDIMIMLENNEDGIVIELESSVMYQYGDSIRQLVMEILTNAGVTNARVVATDRGALDYTIRARVLTALHRAAESEAYEWGA